MKIYALLLESEKYYVGTTDKKISECLAEHLEGGVEWTVKYKMVKLVELLDGDEWDGVKMIFKYMSTYGIRNVRGLCYSSINMDEKDIEAIEKIIGCKKCYGCGGPHYYKQCAICYRCGKRGHSFNGCFSFEDVDGGDLVRCLRCGRKTHWAGTCTESVGIDGAKLAVNAQSQIKSYIFSFFK